MLILNTEDGEPGGSFDSVVNENMDILGDVTLVTNEEEADLELSDFEELTDVLEA